ncbi:MAG: TetR/AcrR family transcriptional regulator [Firmicutes bacterium]|nr:TetR/AcrR family transcriptional regulator [Bacillota bacterium]
MDDKQTKILLTAIEIFSRDGFELASTNEIAKAANVSKGLLFHYFGNKKKLHQACQLHVIDEYIVFMAARRDLSITDFFERVLFNLRVKMDFAVQNPKFLPIVNKIFYDNSDLIDRDFLESHIMESSLGTALKNFWQNIDFTPFRDDVNTAKLMEYTQLGLEALWVKYSAENSENLSENIQNYIADCEEFLKLIKFGVLKNPG